MRDVLRNIYKNIFVGKDSLIRGDRGVDVFRRNDWWVLNGRGSAIGKEGLYIKPDFKDPGHTHVTTVKEMKGYDKYRIVGQPVLKGIGASF